MITQIFTKDCLTQDFLKSAYLKVVIFSEIKQEMSIKNSNSRKIFSRFKFENPNFLSDHRFNLARNYILTKLRPQNHINKLNFEFAKLKDSLYEIEIVDYERKFNEVMNLTDLAKLIAFGLYNTDESVLDENVKLPLDEILSDICIK